MTPQAFLHQCAELEQAVGDLYRRFAARLSSHPAASRLFLELADQEDVHARAMQLMGRLMRGVREGTTVQDGAEKAARAMKEGLSRATRMLDEGRDVTSEAALVVAIRIESSALEAHGSSFLETDSEQLRSTVHMLATDTDQHKAKLEKLLRWVRETEGGNRAA